MGNAMEEIDPPGKRSHDGSVDLNADELAAFEKIMGDIDGQEEEKLNGSAKGTGFEENDDQALTEDDLNKLNDVIETINSENHTDVDILDPANTAAAEAKHSRDESLDEDQQRAFESIMAQIEKGGAADADSRKKAGEEYPSEIADDPAAELEKGMKETDADDKDARAEAQHEESTDNTLDEIQQKALESIMAQIEGGGTADEPESKTVDDSSAKVEKVVKVEGPSEDQEQQNPVNPTNDDADEELHDIPKDINDILTEIASTNEDSHLPEAVADDPVSEPATVELSEKSIVNDDGVARKKEDSGLEHEDCSQTSDPSTDQLPTQKAIPVSLKTLQKTQPLREATKSAGGWPKKTIVATIAAIFFLGLAGYFYWIPPRIVDSRKSSPDTDDRRQYAVVETHPAKQVQEPVVIVQVQSDQSRLKMAAENLDRLRNELIEKRSEIDELRNYYQAGIDAEIQGIVEMLRKTGKGPVPFNAALTDPRIRLGLSAIQRRDTYIKKLETPTNALFWNSEELLFFSRKAGLLALMAGKTSDIDIDGFIKQADEIRAVHGSALAQLNIDTVPASPLALESIWQDIEKRLPTTTIKPENDNLDTDTDNAAILKNICDGDFTRKNALTALSPAAARCLATWKGKDLFLNALTDLSPEAARHLAAWEGDWLGLNGLKELSPEAALHLSRWKGKGLSLNGLSRLSPRVVGILSEWQGEQIELVNVKHMAHWENPKTRLFLSEDLKRKHSALRK